MVRIPRPPEMPYEYRKKYWANWSAKLHKRDIPDPNFIGKCIGCSEKGVLGVDIIHRGVTRPTSALCDCCYKGGDNGAIWNEEWRTQEKAKGRGTKGSKLKMV